LISFFGFYSAARFADVILERDSPPQRNLPGLAVRKHEGWHSAVGTSCARVAA